MYRPEPQLRKSLLALAIAGSLLALAGCADDGDNGSDGASGTSQTLIELNALGTYASGAFDESAAEIVAYDAMNQRLFVVNANNSTVDVLDINDPAMPTLLGTIDASAEGSTANSVAVYGNLVAVAIEATVKQNNGKVVFYNTTDLNKVGEVTVGALPDMVTFTRDGQALLVANEGEPSDDYTNDPEGSVSIVDLANGVGTATVTTAGFTAFNADQATLEEAGLRVFGPGATLAQDMEPEYIAVSIDNQTAWVALQENNAVAELDIAAGEITAIIPLGFKNHSIIGNELDASNDDGGIDIRNWPVKGMYMPDSIAGYGYNGKTYYLTANEGDSRDYDGFSEEFRIADLTLDATAFPDAATLQQDENLGRLNATSTLGNGSSCDPSDPANVTNSQNPEFVQYINNRDFSVSQTDLENGMAGDLGPEGMAFIPGGSSPNSRPMLAVGNEVSGTTTLYGIDAIELVAD